MANTACSKIATLIAARNRMAMARAYVSGKWGIAHQHVSDSSVAR